MVNEAPLATVNEEQNQMLFGKEVINRVSFLRSNKEFIRESIFHPSARFLFYDRANPLLYTQWDQKLVVLTNEAKKLKKEESFDVGLLNMPGWKQCLNTWSKDNEEENSDLRDGEKPLFLFLGLEDESVGLDLQANDHIDFRLKYKGIPYFAVDITKKESLIKGLFEYIKSSNKDVDEESLSFSASMGDYLGFSQTEASLFSHGKMFLDWLNKNRFCPGCGTKTIPVDAGGKIKCTNSKVVGVNKRGKDKYECPVKNSKVSNVSFPRTDAVIITAVTNTDRTKVLLSLNKRFAIAKMYTCTSGFMEPSETVEVATKREIWEETGVACSKINILMTQPWPFPGNLMIGCVAEVDFDGSNEKIHLDHDDELEDARWFDMDFVTKLVYGDESDFNPEGIIIPMPESVAFGLIKYVVDQALAKKSKL